MEVTFAKEYSAVLKDLLHYLGLRKKRIALVRIWQKVAWSESTPASTRCFKSL